MRRGLAGVVAVAVTAGTLLAGASSAGASFPGRNGELIYPAVDFSAKASGPTSHTLNAFNPRTRRTRATRWCSWHGGGESDCTVEELAASPGGKRLAVIERTPPLAAMGHRLTVVSLADMSRVSAPLSRPSFDPAWAPGGDALLVTRYDGPAGERGGGVPRVFLIGADGRDLGPAAPPGSSNADWAANGTLAYVHDGNLWTLPPGGAPRQLTTAGGDAPSWSPDGRRLAFERNGRIWTVRADGTGERRVGKVGGTAPAWSPDGRYIAFAGPGPPRRVRGIWIVRAGGRCVQEVRRAGLFFSVGLPVWAGRQGSPTSRRLPSRCGAEHRKRKPRPRRSLTKP